MEKGSHRPDPPKLRHQTVRRAVAATPEFMPAVPLIAGGKSFGGRMTSQVQALAPFPRCVVCACLDFPCTQPNSGR
jgi:predicted alpha/beta-hydrolase family hydrolase